MPEIIEAIGAFSLAIGRSITNPDISDSYDFFRYDNGIPNDNPALHKDAQNLPEDRTIEEETIDDKVYTLVPDSAVLVIDMQEVFLRHIEKDGRKNLEDAQIEIIRYCAEYDIPVIEIILPRYNDPNKTVNRIRQEIIHCRKHVLLRKDRTSAFNRTNLKGVLDELSVKNIFLMGVYSHACIFYTAYDAISQGFSISTSSQVVSEEIKDGRFRIPYTIRKDNLSLHEWYRENCVFFGEDFRKFFPRMKEYR